MTAKDIFLEWVFPMIGGIVGTAMFTVPLKAVLKARRERVLGVRLLFLYPAVRSPRGTSARRLQRKKAPSVPP
jgi:hypothetical protein